MAMPIEVILLVYALAVARVTRLINRDRILDGPRALVYRYLPHVFTGPDSTACERCATSLVQTYRGRVLHDVKTDTLGAYLIGCPWCVSIYVGALASPLVWWLGGSPWLLVPALALAFSEVTGLLARGE